MTKKKKEDSLPPKQKGWRNLKEKAAAGEYDLVVPLDYLAIELLPDEGELDLGFYPRALTTGQLIKERFGNFTPGQTSGIMKRLEMQGLVVRVRTTGARQFGYQRTPQGKKLYEEWKASNNNNSKKPEEGK